jgi:crotonobetainyl-CoA:carnitine CoA-transferase CaiB-like acyl-CoA transferase
LSWADFPFFIAPNSGIFKPTRIGGFEMLEGLRVIEFATYIAAPGAGGMLADWGADVIKVEPKAGDPIRMFFGSLGATEEYGNPVFDLDNRGKRSMTLDTTKPEGREALYRLVKDADVFLTNVRPGGLERAKLDWQTLKEINPRLIYCSVSGYGLKGEERDRPGFDNAAFWSRAGVARLITPKGDTPMPIRTAMGDHTTSMATASGILAALYDRNNTGRGRLVETSLLRTGIYVSGSDMAIQLRLGRVASTRRREEAINPIGNYFMSKDGTWIGLVPRQGNSEWRRLLGAIDRMDLEKHENYANAKARKKNSAELIEILDKEFAKRDLAEWAKILDELDVVWAPVQSPAQVAEDAQAHAAGAFVEVPSPEGDTFRSPAGPVRFHPHANEGPESLDRPRGPAPGQGEHTDEILLEAGFSAAEIASLRAAEAV